MVGVPGVSLAVTTSTTTTVASSTSDTFATSVSPCIMSTGCGMMGARSCQPSWYAAPGSRFVERPSTETVQNNVLAAWNAQLAQIWQQQQRIMYPQGSSFQREGSEVDRTLGMKDYSPFEIWFRVRPVVAHMIPFWIETFSHNHEVHRTKFDTKAQKGRLVDYHEQSQNYRIFDPVKRTTFVARDVSFKPANELQMTTSRMPSYEWIRTEEDEPAHDTQMKRSGKDINRDGEPEDVEMPEPLDGVEEG